MSDKKIIIAIDGYSSSGKSTMARALAAKIGYRYIDSGAMYRAVTLYALNNNMIDAQGNIDTSALISVLPSISIDFRPMPDGTQHTLLNGEDVETEIRQLRVSDNVSPIAAIKEVRAALTAMQRSLGKDKGIVMDGRDIGTTVFPNAELKIFVNASAEMRARRRFLEMSDKGDNVNYEEVLANVVRRDHIDETRAESPLRRADDAIDLDNSYMTHEEQDAWLEQQVNKALHS
ncbi:MAG: (d)CMP kinase [Muribaculaceae bacterium]|nr:(d)CMP kinase [Muribaculaceae bacterium]